MDQKKGDTEMVVTLRIERMVEAGRGGRGEGGEAEEADDLAIY